MTSVTVMKQKSETIFSGCVADEFERGVLTVTDESGRVAQVYAADKWREATVFDHDGYPIASFAAPRTIVSICGWCPNVAERTAEETRLGHDVSHGLCADCEARLWKEDAQ